MGAPKFPENCMKMQMGAECVGGGASELCLCRSDTEKVLNAYILFVF